MRWSIRVTAIYAILIQRAKFLGLYIVTAWRRVILPTPFYGCTIVTVIPVSSTVTAGTVKLTENIFRAVNVVLFNELNVVLRAMGIDIWEVIKTVRTKPLGFVPFYPNPGSGGQSIPINT